jgi:hypothetical protein
MQQQFTKSSAVVQQIIKSSWRQQRDSQSSAWPTPVYGSENETVWSNANDMGFMADLGKQANRFVER